MEDTPEDAIDLLAAGPDGVHRLRTPRLDIAVNGAGDAIAALFLFHMLHHRQRCAGDGCAPQAPSTGCSARTQEAGSRELLLVAAQDQFLMPCQNCS